MSSQNGNGFTPTQKKILEVLSDGLPHTPEELMKCLWDDLSTVQALFTQICHIRKKLRPAGQDIIAEYVRRDCQYRHVRLLSTSE